MFKTIRTLTAGLFAVVLAASGVAAGPIQSGVGVSERSSAEKSSAIRMGKPLAGAAGAALAARTLPASGPITGGRGNVTFTSGQPAVKYPAADVGVSAARQMAAPATSVRRPGEVTPGMLGAPSRAEEFAPAPGAARAIMPVVTSEEMAQALRTRVFPGNLNQGTSTVTGVASASSRSTPVVMQAMRVGGDANPLAPASIAELARSLRYHPDLIYQFVRNNIEFYPTWGVQKGAFGTILDNQGNPFDQSALMVALLRASGFETNYVRGVVRLSAQNVKDWYGLETSDACAVANALAQGQIPIYALSATSAGPCPGAGPRPLTNIAVEHIWVKVKIDGAWYSFDPSYKPHVFKTGIDLGNTSITGYSAGSYLSSAMSGATVTADYVQNVHRANVRSNLTTYAGNLANYLRANKPTATLDDVIGGQEIVPYYGAIPRQASIPTQDTGWGTEEFAEIPNGYKPTLRIQYAGIDQTYTSDAIYGKLLTITYNAANQPVLKLDGVAVGSPGTATTAGTNTFVNFTVKHNGYASANGDHNFSQRLVAGGGNTYVIANGWGPTGRGLIQSYADKLETLRASGAAENSEQVLGSSLSILGAQWMTQFNHASYIAGRLSQTAFISHHQVGIVGYTNAAYVDLAGVIVSNASAVANTDNERTAFLNGVLHSSILESTAVRQTSGVEAVSTVKLIDIASAAGQRIYNANALNYAGVVQPNLVNCSAHYANFNTYLAAGMRLILPARCDIQEGGWKGAGYYSLKAGVTMALGANISGGLSGGNPIAAIALGNLNAYAQTVGLNSPSSQTQIAADNFGRANYWGDPIDMVRGNFLYDRADMRIGVGSAPLSLTFTRQYSSGMRNRPGPLGRGWTHGFAASAAVSSDGLQGMGEDSALDAVGVLIEQKVSSDLLKDANVPIEKLVVATLGQRWFGEQLVDNTVVVNQGLNGEIFVRLPDGTYNPPPGKPVKLTRNADTTFSYQSVDKAVLKFNMAGKAETLTDPSGLQLKYTYTGADLTGVENSLGRFLKFGVAAGRITQVSDGIRTVRYGYDASANLVSFSDSRGESTSYRYDLPGQMTQVFYPSFPTVAAFTNVYDSLGRVKTQTSARGKLYTYYFAGTRTEEVSPGNVTRTAYLDAAGNVVQQGTPTGQWTINTYDGQSRLVDKLLPEGNITRYAYDDATCASADKRCTHNLKTLTSVGKPGSDLAERVQSFTYERTFNKVATVTDARGKVTSYTYTAQGLPLTVTSPADAAGVAPQTSHTYVAYTPSGFPTFYLPATQTVKTTSANSVTTTMAYDVRGYYVPVASVVDSGAGKLNLATTFDYDPIGNLTMVDGPRTDVRDLVSITYDNERRQIYVTDPAGKLSRTIYDKDGRATITAAQFGAQWLVTCTRYSETGKTTRTWGPGLTAAATTCPDEAAPVPITDIAYDDLDRPFRTTQFMPASDGGDRVTETVYDDEDRVIAINKAVGTAMAQNDSGYSYTRNGNLDASRDAKGNLTVYQYDGFDRLMRTYYPMPASPGWANGSDYEENTHDAGGNVTTIRKRNGQTITQTWDNLNRLTARGYPTQPDNIQYAYDLRGLRTAAQFANGSHSITYVWDNAGRQLSATAGGKTIAYQYDAGGNRVRTTWPDAFFTTTSYDGSNRANVIKENGTVNLASYAYDDLGRRATVTLGNGTTVQRSYDSQGALATLKNFLSSAAQEVQYTYVRNPLRELKGVTWSNNLYQWAGAAVGTRSYTANGLNQYTVAAGAVQTHDVNGNLKSDGTWVYGYDLDNRLRTATRSGTAATLSYDAEGRMRQSVIGAATINLLYDGQNLIAEYDAANTNVLRKYVHGPGSDEPIVWYEGNGTASKNWLYADHLGSIVATANGAGAGTGIYSYGPFGEPNVGTGPRFRYTGQQLIGELGLYYYKARFYSPATGRFLQADPIGYRDDQNLYAYVGNNPGNRFDPTGLAGVRIGQEAIFGTQLPIWSDGVDSIVSSAPIFSNGNFDAGGKGQIQIAWTSTADMLNRNRLSALEGGGGLPPPSYTPLGAGRNGAFNEAKRLNGIPVSQQPLSVLPNLDRKGVVQPGRQYIYDIRNPNGQSDMMIIRDDAAGHDFGSNNSQNRGPHFNDPIGRHYDY